MPLPWLLLLLAAHGSLAIGADPARRPNVILVMADDLGWGDVGFNGNRRIRTPHLDQMAAGSLKFTRFYAAAPVCSPTRGSALTGRHPYRYGVTFANAGFLKPQEVTLAEILRAEGYATGMFGKWHLGSLTTQVRDANRGGPGSEAIYAPPPMHGFDECFCTESKVPTFDPLRVPRRFARGGSRAQGWDALAGGDEWDFYGTRYWNQQGEEIGEPLRGDDSRIILDRALPFIARAVEAGRPFLAVIWFHAPHLPVVAGPEHRALYAGENLLHGNYFGCVTALDEQVGRLRRTLRELQVADNTLVWFASDNGPEGNARAPGSAGSFRGRKRSLYEGGVRVPALLEWPAKIREPRATDFPAVTSDYLPTVLDVLGVPHPRPAVPLDGLSLLPLIEGTQHARPAPIGFRSGNMLALSGNRYKLVLPGGNQPAELYDLQADPAESRDLAGEQPEVVARMRRRLADWVRSCDASASGADYAGQDQP